MRREDIHSPFSQEGERQTDVAVLDGNESMCPMPGVAARCPEHMRRDLDKHRGQKRRLGDDEPEKKDVKKDDAVAVSAACLFTDRHGTQWRFQCDACDYNDTHANSNDPRCPYHRRPRLAHADASFGDFVPHMSQTNITVFLDSVQQNTGPRREPYWYAGRVLEFDVDDQRFELGTASGAGCNCLIDTLRKLLEAMLPTRFPKKSVDEVRRLLEHRHRGRATRITPGEYLDLALYWEDIVDLFGMIHQEPQLRRALFEIVCVDVTWIGHGERLPAGASREGKRTLFVARVNQNHFVPMHALSTASSTSTSSHSSLPLRMRSVNHSEGPS